MLTVGHDLHEQTQSSLTSIKGVHSQRNSSLLSLNDKGITSQKSRQNLFKFMNALKMSGKKVKPDQESDDEKHTVSGYDDSSSSRARQDRLDLAQESYPNVFRRKIPSIFHKKTSPKDKK